MTTGKGSAKSRAAQSFPWTSGLQCLDLIERCLSACDACGSLRDERGAPTFKVSELPVPGACASSLKLSSSFGDVLIVQIDLASCLPTSPTGPRFLASPTQLNLQDREVTRAFAGFPSKPQRHRQT